MAVMRAEVRAAIVDDLRAGKSQTSTAKRHKVSPATVNGIAKAEGIAPNIRPPKIAILTRKAYTLEARLELIDRFFARLDSGLDSAMDGDLKDMALTLAVLIDKRRLEEGKATDRHEFIDDDRELIARRMDELAARRRAKEVAGELHPETGAATAV